MDKTYLEAWLTLQCQVIPEVRRAFVRVEGGAAGERGLLAAWPAGSRFSESMRELLDVSLRSGTGITSHTGLRQKAAGSDTVPSTEEAALLLAHPLALDESMRGAVVLELPAGLKQRQQAVTNLLGWGNAWLQFARRHGEQGAADEAGAVDLARRVADQASFPAAVLAALGWLAHRFHCRRVSLGVVHGRGYRLSASSDKAVVDQRGDLARRLEEAMQAARTEAATDPDAEDPPPLQRDPSGKVYTGLLRVDGRDFAAVTLEPRSHKTLTPARQREMAELLPLLGDVLGLRWQRERPWRERVREALRPAGARYRPLAYSAALLVLLLWLGADTAYRVGGPAVIEGAVQRALIAPFDGYVASAPVRAGERVVAGQTLAELDDRELRVQRRLREGDRAEFEKEFRQALAGMDHAQARILSSQIGQAEAEIELLDGQLARTRLLAPFDGLVVSGDLSRSLGKPVERGEVLFEVAPLDSYRVVVEVRDRDIREVGPGLGGALVLAALPSRRLPLKVVNITHFAGGEGPESGDFRVEAQLLEPDVPLRPGMRGVAKIEVDRRPRIDVWTHDLVDWLRLRLWAWLP